ncbi:GrpB family protein [Nitriliruptoraceae bacterium ZYF776]|nr:GrpB family protein [Profundirhabdus halotolerans]
MQRPIWADEPVRITPPDAALAAEADRLRRELQTLLAPWLAGTVEHVGSTAVPGLQSKPIVDLLGPVRDLDAADDAAATLAAANWELVPPEADIRPWRRFHVLPRAGARAAHLHLIAHDHPRCREMLVFRDHLRRDRRTAAAYGRLKERLARDHVLDREAYTRAKAAFVDEVLEGLGER